MLSGYEGLVLGFSTLGLILGLVITYWLHSRYHLDIVVQPGTAVLEAPAAISVIIPARNEARNIRRCLGEILAQTYPNLEVIVVDDRSTDGTGRILQEIASQCEKDGTGPALKIVPGEDLPPGWAGKPHALAQGAGLAAGEWLCFLDADTFAGLDLLSAAYGAACEHQADLLSILTAQELGTFWEKAVLPLVFTALSVGFSPRRVNDPSSPEAIANGQFILIRRPVYDAVGGHTAIHDQVVEDKALAERVKRSGHRLLVADGRQVARTRMYTNLGEIWEGWTKNIYLGLQDRVGLLLVGVVVAIAGALILPAWLAAGIAWYLTSPALAPALVIVQALLLWGVLLVVRAAVCRAYEIPIGYALTFPLGTGVFAGMMIASAFKVLSGQGVTWKGRRYG
jgi:chlorobactene glucosyltransferase